MAFVFFQGKLINANQAVQISLIPPEQDPKNPMNSFYAMSFVMSSGAVERVGFFSSPDVAKTAFNKFADWLASGSTELFNADKISLELNQAAARSAGR